ncbi:hypothetical protein NA57DRAFT_63844 [Rhizodiscina lignyota]|uniref:Nucleoside diphosphatase n=1 Tax=Rhizodiscina lignyota TaxID=1504668 RepID=A0A9P4INQ5_9PEZI|nr:hypothetical protein NA57DRAFT_63844 [Rhizodiscina lignyota]
MGKWNFGVILDAGSSGTRVHIYKWKKHERALKDADKKDLQRLPKVKTDKDWTKKIHPGVSTFGNKPEQVGPDHLKPLFEHALSIIPKDEVPNTPIFLLATAGVRLLPDYERQTLLKEICSYAQKNTKFQLPDCDIHIQVIPGETEGLYGWIAANYLLEGFDKPDEHDHGKGHHTYGFLDMGGASAQIAFAPNSTEAIKHANDLKLLRLRTVNGEASEYKVFTTTWLGFGANESRRRYVNALKETTNADEMELPDPCLPKGLEVTEEGKPISPGTDEAKGKALKLVGTGQFQECLKRTKPLLEKDAPCLDDPCLLNGVHVPSIDFDVNHFVGVSEYWHTTHEIFEMAHKDKSYDWHTYQDRVNEFCGSNWKDIVKDVEAHTWGKKVDGQTAQEVCFKASWLINVLHEGIGIPRVGLEDMNGSGHNGTKAVLDKAKQKGYLEPFQAVNKIEGVEVSWTLGKMVLYASSQVPPAEKALAVGFGSNIAGIPSDFQHAGGSPLNSGYTGDDDDMDWHDQLFKDSPRRIPGLVIFLLIVALAAYLLCGRDRRSTLSSKFRRMVGGPGTSGSSRRRRFPFISSIPGASKLFSQIPSGPAYDRLETGEVEDTDFELPDMGSLAASDSDSQGSPKVAGRSSGNAGASHPPKSSGGLGPGLYSGNAMDRGGLLSRTESRDRLSPPSLGGSPKRERASRTGSPTRKMNALAALHRFQESPSSYIPVTNEKNS